MQRTLILTVSGLSLMLAACSGADEPAATAPAIDEAALEEELLENYVKAINSNDLDTIMAMLAEDVAFQAPHGPEVVGKEAVREWVGGYYDAFDTQWKKTSLSFDVSGDIAVERYAYESNDTLKETGDVFTDEGKGINVYKKGEDGKWLVVIDGWSTDVPLPEMAASDDSAKAPVEMIYEGFAAGDMAMVLGTMSPDIVWNEAEGNPYSDKNPYEGPEAVLTGLFARLGGEWDGFSATPAEFVVDGDRVVVFGRYGGINLATGKPLDVPFVHSWTVEDGKIIAFQQYTDTLTHTAAMTE
ncbi:nuclear transport factor 2 family protein [Parvularcula marina]|nr:nuclear transport factor 2 family protein [Parvularcula marina]